MDTPKFSDWDALEGMGEENNDKSQDTKWLREGFLHRGAEIDWLVTRERKAWRRGNIYQALFGITLGIMIAVVVTA